MSGDATEELKAIVADFNTKLGEWTKKHDCRVTFGWLYNAGTEKQIKAMEIIGIDRIIYRKPPPKGISEMFNENNNN